MIQSLHFELSSENSAEIRLDSWVFMPENLHSIGSVASSLRDLVDFAKATSAKRSANCIVAYFASIDSLQCG